MDFDIKHSGELLKDTFKAWNAKDPFRQSAVIAYYSVFSMPGLLVLIIAITGYFFGRDIVNGNIIQEVSKTMGPDTAKQVGDMLASATKTKTSVIGSIIGLVVLLMGATGVFVELQKTLNTIWEVKVAAKSGIWAVVKSRLFSFGLILAIAFLLLISLVVSTGLAAMGNLLHANDSGFVTVIFNVINFIVSLAIISALFAMMYKILPDAQIEWKHVWLGAFLTGLLFTIGKTALAFYFGKADPASGYGAAGSIVLILLWVSYSSMILFFGAEFTATYAKKYSGKVPPSDIAKEHKTPAEAS